MKKLPSIALAVTGLLMGGALPAKAQNPPLMKNLFVDVNIGFQAGSESLTINSTPVIYDETAIIDSTQSLGGVPFLDVTAGYRVWRDLSVGLGFTNTFGGSSDAAVSASIPSPFFFDRRLLQTSTVSDLGHNERMVHLLVMWTSPVTDKIDATVMLGPSYVRVSQDLVRTVTVPAGTQNATASSETQTASAAGFAVGGDITYMVTPRIGVGGLLRYVKASVDLESVPDLKAGGFQIGGGIRFRF